VLPKIVEDTSIPSSGDFPLYVVPAIDKKDGNKSIAANTDSTSIVPWLAAGIIPGCQAMKGDLIPPSYNWVLYPSKFPALLTPTSGPLSLVKTISVFFDSSASSLIKSNNHPNCLSISCMTPKNLA